MVVKNSPGLSASLPGVDSARAEYKKTVNLPVATFWLVGEVVLVLVAKTTRPPSAGS